MSERLRLLSKAEEDETPLPRTDSLLQLLLQGLQSGDRKILNSVLDRADDNLIENTTRKLPAEYAIRLVEELDGRFSLARGKWLLATLRHHASVLMTNKALLQPLLTSLEARTAHYADIVALKGKLDLMTRQITTQDVAGASELASKDALLGKFERFTF